MFKTFLFFDRILKIWAGKALMPLSHLGTSVACRPSGVYKRRDKRRQLLNLVVIFKEHNDWKNM